MSIAPLCVFCGRYAEMDFSVSGESFTESHRIAACEPCLAGDAPIPDDLPTASRAALIIAREILQTSAKTEEAATMSKLEAFVTDLLIRHRDVPCAGCRVPLRSHDAQDHNYFPTWGDQDETWKGRRGSEPRMPSAPPRHK
jgi:hypothetical protein